MTFLDLEGKTPLPQRSCKSARPSFVPSASTTTVPYQPGSMNKSVCGMDIRAGGIRVRFGPYLAAIGAGGGRMRKDERWTQRTTLRREP